MGYERYPRDTDPQGDYYNRSETQDYGRDYGAGRGYSSARDYQAAGQGRDEQRGGQDRDDRHGGQRYGQQERGGYRDGNRDFGFGQDRDSGYYQGQQEQSRGSYGSGGRRFEDPNRSEFQGRDRYSRDQGGRDQGRQGYGRQPQGYDYDERGFMARAGDEVRSWFGDEEAERRRDMDARRDEREYSRGSEGFHPHHDRDYHEWRRGQIDALDRDYAEYRRENRQRFSNEFSTWRTSRQSQRDLLKKVDEHMDVVGSDGEHVGTVDKVRGDRIILTKNDADAGGHHHSIPCSWLQSVEGKVTLARTAAEAKAAWRDEERQPMFGEQQDGDRDQNQARDAQGRMLNRSFSGTY
jgi:hypothetical protein